MAPSSAGTARTGTFAARHRRPAGPGPSADDDTPAGSPGRTGGRGGGRRRTSGRAVDLPEEPTWAGADAAAPEGAATATPAEATAGTHPRSPRHPRIRRPRRWVVAAAVVAATVLVVGLVVDAGLGGRRAPIGRVDGPAAGTTIADYVNGLATDLAGEEAALRRCPPLSTVGGLVCTEATDQRMGAEVAAFVRAVARVRVPGADTVAAARLRRDATTLSDDLMALGASPTAASYTASAQSRGVRPLGRAVDGDAKALVGALRD